MALASGAAGMLLNNDATQRKLSLWLGVAAIATAMLSASYAANAERIARIQKALPNTEQLLSPMQNVRKLGLKQKAFTSGIDLTADGNPHYIEIAGLSRKSVKTLQMAHSQLSATGRQADLMT